MKLLLRSALALAAGAALAAPLSAAPFSSIDLGEHTATKIRSATRSDVPFIVASSYEGTMLGVGYHGEILWKNPLSGYQIRDIWCADITGDGSDEILAACADGALYCMDSAGRDLWSFRPSVAPMNAVCTLANNGDPTVVCGGYDLNVYYLSPAGKLLKTLPSSTYSVEKPWGKPGAKRIPPAKRHIANFIRPLRGKGGKEILAIQGTHNSNSSRGSIYLFKPLQDKPFHIIDKLQHGKTYGDFHLCDTNGDGADEILLGSSSMIQDANVLWVDPATNTQRTLKISELRRRIDGFGYRVVQTVPLGKPGAQSFLTLFGSRILLSPADLELKSVEVLENPYSFNDIHFDKHTGRILLASAQTGGSCVHVIDPAKPGWKSAYRNFQPTGKLKAVLDNTATARKQLASFTRPAHERKPLPVYFMTENLDNDLEERALALQKEHGSPVFLQSTHHRFVEKWDRSKLGNKKYETRRDRRMKYTGTQQQMLDKLLPLFETERGQSGVSFWGGHGNDPYLLATDTMLKIGAAAKGRKGVFIYPELEQYDDDFAFVLNDHLYPMAGRFHNRNLNLYIRTKHAFWQSIIYLPLWSRLRAGEFADVFVPSMEETTDKTMEQSVAGRVGIWASGAVDQWGARGARDNPSFDRLRQHSHQMVPNHFLRMLVYNVSYGATYLNNFSVDQEYFSILYELIAKGALYVPKREEIVSFSPVHLSMTEPDKHYLDEGNNGKWTTFFDPEFEKANHFVFSRLNGTWPGAPVTDWDFSRYAANVKDRRLNFIPPYQNGLVLITPVQNGPLADSNPPRGKLADKLHPIYQNILREYITDGRDYLSPNGKQRTAADKGAKTIETVLRKASEQLPLTVTGEVGWVVAQTGPKNLRLTLIDGGYINPRTRKATVRFHTAKPARMRDLLDGTEFTIADPSAIEIEIPCGLFRFLDIELAAPL